MPNIAETKKIFEVTPIDQPVMLIGIHGIGKSEIVKQIFEKQGYVVITLFLGQMADAGDMIGLPDRTTIKINYKGEKIEQKITEFCPPKWWPVDSDAKVVIFMDEFNRGKPEIYQCVFDMVLNRKLNGYDLPTKTRIIAAMNPAGEKEGYDVTELDPALIDRFNNYEFRPEIDEWLDWALKAHISKYVMGFISKNGSTFLDPPDAKSRKMGENYPSRRSWKRISDILNEYPELINEENMVTMKTLFMGIIGAGATSALANYIKEMSKGISAGKIVTGWDKECERKIKQLSKTEYVHINREIAVYIAANEKTLFDAVRDGGKYAHNVEKYLHCIPKELAAEFMDHVTQSHQNGLSWADKLLTLNPKLVNWFVDVLHGKDKTEQKLQEEKDKPWSPDDESGPNWDGVGGEIDDLLN